LPDKKTEDKWFDSTGLTKQDEWTRNLNLTDSSLAGLRGTLNKQRKKVTPRTRDYDKSLEDQEKQSRALARKTGT
jgi:hypothetical protein